MLNLSILTRNVLRKIPINSLNVLLIKTKTHFTEYETENILFNNYLKPDRNDSIFTEKLSKMTKVYSDVRLMSESVSDGRQSADQLIARKEFQDISESIIELISNFSNKYLISLLQSFLTIGIDPNIQVVKYLENELLWRSRNLSFKCSLMCLSYHIRHRDTELQKQLVNQLIVRIQTQLDEAKDVYDILMLLKLSESFTQECIDRIHKIALDLVADNGNEEFKGISLCYLLVLLSQFKRRNKPLIRAIINRLIGLPLDQMQVLPTYLIKTVCSLNTLNYPDVNLLTKLSDLLCNDQFLDKVSASDRKDLLVAINQLNFNYPRLIDAYIEKMTDKPDLFSTQEKVTLVLSCARLYYQPFMSEILSSYIIPEVKQNSIETNLWLNYVWSLAILGNPPVGHINSVLNNDFCDKLFTDSNSFDTVIKKLKLFNIKAVSDIELKTPIDLPNALKSGIEMPKKSLEVELFKNLITVSLDSFLPKDKYLAIDVKTPFGFNIDVELIIDSNITPLPIEKYGVFGANPNSQTNPIPLGFKRVCIMTYGFNDTLLCNTGQIGVHELAVRLLRNIGYTVVVINHTSVPSVTTAIKRVQILRKLLTDLFEPKMDNY